MKKLYILIMLSLFACFTIQGIENNKSKEDKIHQELIKKWLDYAHSGKGVSPFSSQCYNYDNHYLDKIKKIGPKIFPVIFKYYKDRSFKILSNKITKFHAENYFDDKRNLYIYPDYPNYFYMSNYNRQKFKLTKYSKNICQYWWEEGHKKTPELFEQFYKKVKEADDEKKHYEKIQNLGIHALPLIMKELQKGDKKFIPILSYLTNDEIKKTFTIKECVTYWNTNKEKWTIPFEKINYNMKD